MFIRTLAAAFALVLTGTVAQAQEAAAPAPGPADATTIPDMRMGNPEARVQITEYSSFTCPHCARFHAESMPRLKAEYIDTGKVGLTYREVYFDRYGLWAAMLARCGGESRYFGISEILFSTQTEWAGSNDPAVVTGNLKRIGRSVGMADAELDACFENRAMAEAMVAKFQADSTADGVEGTPTFIINGTKYPNMTFEDMKAIIDPLLAE